MAKYQNYPTIVYENLKQMYHASAETYGEKTLFMQKEEGEYKSYSFRQYAEEVDALGTALCARGLKGKRIIVSGENGYDWVRAYMAVICGVGVVVPVDKEIPAEEIANIARESEAVAILHSDKLSAKVEALDESVARLPFSSLPALIEQGKKRIAEGDRTFLDAEIDPNAMSSLLFTSGTTGVSKGVMLSHRNICFNLSEMCQMLYIDDKDLFLSVLPIHHAYECTCGFLCQVYRGSTVAFSEGLRHITRNMQEVHPTMILCVPLLLETMYNKVWANIRKQGLEGKVKAAIKMTNAIPNAKLRLAAKRRVFAQIHKSFGGRLRIMISGGAAVDPKIMQGLRDLGIAAYQGYGLTECAPLAALNRDTFYNDGSAGMATPNALLDIYDVQGDGTGEIRYKGDNIMLGYYKQPDVTADTFTDDGYMRTGDLGIIDKYGNIYIKGRSKNMILTANGQNIYPEEIEELLNAMPHVRESIIINRKNRIVAIVATDNDDSNPLSKSQLETIMKANLVMLNQKLPAYAQVSDIEILVDDFERTPKNSIKRFMYK